MIERTHTCLWLALAAVFAALPAAGARAQGFADRFHHPGINGRVWGLGTWNGDLYAGGPFRFQTGGGELHRIARYDGSGWHDVGGGADGGVRAFADYGGELIVAGSFDQVGSVRAESIARWNGTRWATLGAGMTGYLDEIFALEVFQGELYAGGRFKNAGGQSIAGIARWNGTSWRPVGGGLGVASSGYPIVISFEVVGQTLYVGGEFTTAGGKPALSVAAWDGTSWSGLGTGLNDGVHALAWYKGELYAGGTFRSAGTVQTLKIARWNGSSWGPVGLGIPDSSIAVQVNALEVYGGDLWVCGSFGEVDAVSKGAGLFASALARWDGNAWGSVGGLFRNVFGGQDYGIAATVHDGKLIVGGDFQHAGPVLDHANNIVSYDIVAWNGTRFEAMGEGLGAHSKKSVRWQDSTWTLTNLYAGEAVSPQIARFDGVRWHIVGPLHPRSDVEDVIVYKGTLHFAGSLEFRNGPTLSGVVRYDGQSWTSLGGGGDVLAEHAGELYAGGLGGIQRLTASGWVSLPAIYGQVQAMQSFQGRLYIGGSSLRVASGPAVNLLVWDGQTLAPVGNGMDRTVTTLHVHAGELWIGGWFSKAGSVSSPRLARFDGAQFRAFPGPAITGPMVRTLATLGGDLYVGGDLGIVGTTRTTLVRWDGVALTPLGEGTNSTPMHLLPDQAAGTLWISGGFWRAGNTVSHGIAVWQAKPRWQDLGGTLARSNGVRPYLEAFGALRQNEWIAFRASGFAPGQLALLVLGNTRVDLPLFGGTLVPAPHVTFALATDLAGGLRIDTIVPSGLPTGFELFTQVWGLDVTRNEFSATNAVVGR